MPPGQWPRACLLSLHLRLQQKRSPTDDIARYTTLLPSCDTASQMYIAISLRCTSLLQAYLSRIHGAHTYMAYLCWFRSTCWHQLERIQLLPCKNAICANVSSLLLLLWDSVRMVQHLQIRYSCQSLPDTCKPTCLKKLTPAGLSDLQCSAMMQHIFCRMAAKSCIWIMPERRASACDMVTELLMPIW